MEEARIVLHENTLADNPIGIELEYPNHFKGSISGSSNEITGTEKDFAGIPEEIKERLRAN